MSEDEQRDSEEKGPDAWKAALRELHEMIAARRQQGFVFDDTDDIRQGRNDRDRQLGEALGMRVIEDADGEIVWLPPERPEDDAR